jgi:hypothetical protein
METDTDKILLLISEWREILRNQEQIAEQRKDGIAGIMVCKDDLALKYQMLQSRVYEIKGRLLGRCGL